jgi:hypothetical protein
MMRKFIVSYLLFLFVFSLKSQTWVNHVDNSGFSFSFPGQATKVDTLGQKIYYYPIDTTVYFSAIHSTNANVQGISFMDSLIIQEGGDTLRALVKSTSFVSDADVEALNNIEYITSSDVVYNGNESTLVFKKVFYGNKKLVSFMRMFKKGTHIYIFSVIGLDNQLSQLISYKNKLFNSIVIN